MPGGGHAARECVVIKFSVWRRLSRNGTAIKIARATTHSTASHFFRNHNLPEPARDRNAAFTRQNRKISRENAEFRAQVGQQRSEFLNRG